MEAKHLSCNFPILQQLFIRRYSADPIHRIGRQTAYLHGGARESRGNTMFCCGGTEEDTYAAPASRHPAAPRNTSQHNAGKDLNSNISSSSSGLNTQQHTVSQFATMPGRGKPRGPNAPRSSGPPKVLPVDVPAISMGELNNITGSFGPNALIGEGSYGKIYRAVLTSGEPVAIKKLDPSVSSDSLADFSAQVHRTH